MSEYDDGTDVRVFGVLPDGYETRIWRISNVLEPDSYYWKVWFEGEVVNGGLADSTYEARDRIRHYRWMDVTKRFRWDRDSRSWVRKKEIM